MFTLLLARSEYILTSRPLLLLHYLLSSIERTRNFCQRIIVFLGSPIYVPPASGKDEQSMVKVEKCLREKCGDGMEAVGDGKTTLKSFVRLFII